LFFSPHQTLELQAVRMLAMCAGFFVLGHTRRWHFSRVPFHLLFGLLISSLLLIFLDARWLVLAVGCAALGAAVAIGYVLSAYYSMLSPERQGGMLGVHEALL